MVAAAVSTKVLGRVRPLAVSFIVTEKCNLFCSYCQIQEKHTLSTEQVFTVIDRLCKVGTKMLMLTGGEPFIRGDLDKIVDYCNQKDLPVKVNTNGTFLRKRQDILKKLNSVTVSLDGPADVHDFERGEGAHEQAMDGIKVVVENGIKLNLNAVLSRNNTRTECIDYLLDVADKNNTYITFQPSSEEVLRGDGKNPASPDTDVYRKIIDYIIEKKKQKLRVGNSVTGLLHLRTWPNLAAIPCAGHSLYRRIDNTGNIQICGIVQESFGNIFDDDYERMFKDSNERMCDKCWCWSRVELNKVAAGSIDAGLNVVSRFFH